MHVNALNENYYGLFTRKKCTDVKSHQRKRHNHTKVTENNVGW